LFLHLGIAVSPISNDKLFLKLANNPFHKLFKRGNFYFIYKNNNKINIIKIGLNVALSTDDPLIMHLTK
jgi:adenosine deaminase